MGWGGEAGEVTAPTSVHSTPPAASSEGLAGWGSVVVPWAQTGGRSTPPPDGSCGEWAGGRCWICPAARSQWDGPGNSWGRFSLLYGELEL